MALIKCEECGQTVSDKAEACPHCGCPVDKESVFSQPEDSESFDLQEEDDKPQRNMSWLGIVAGILLVGGSLSFFLRDCNRANVESADKAVVSIDTVPAMAAPFVAVDDDGLYDVETCATTYDGLEIVSHKLEGIVSSIDVKRNGQLMCTFTFGEDDGVTGDQVHFLDANFDGYVDFMFGPGCDREWSALFFWDNDQSKFVRAKCGGGWIFNGSFKFQPSSQKVFAEGSGSFSSINVRRMSWSGIDLVTEEYLTEELLTSRLDDEWQPARYVIRNGKDDKIIFKSNDPNKIPERWKKWAFIPSAEQEAEYEEASQQEMAMCDDSFSNDYADIEEVKSWIQGNWRYRMVTEFGSMDVRIGISGDYIVVMMNGEMYYSGEYTIDGDCLRYHGGNGASDVIYIDREHHRLMATKTQPMTRI